MNGKERLMKYS